MPCAQRREGEGAVEGIALGGDDPGGRECARERLGEAVVHDRAAEDPPERTHLGSASALSCTRAIAARTEWASSSAASSEMRCATASVPARRATSAAKEATMLTALLVRLQCDVGALQVGPPLAHAAVRAVCGPRPSWARMTASRALRPIQ